MGARKPRRSLRRHLWTERESKRSTQGPSFLSSLAIPNGPPARPIPSRPILSGYPPFYCVACQLSVRPRPSPRRRQNISSARYFWPEVKFRYFRLFSSGKSASDLRG